MHPANATRSPGESCLPPPRVRTRTGGVSRAGLATLLLVAVATLSAVSAHAGRVATGAGGCPVVAAIAPDTTTSIGARSLASGRGAAQTIIVADTLIRSVTLWMPGHTRLTSHRLHLWITRTDADGRPEPEHVVADAGRPGECQVTPAGQVRCQFDFVPPIALPERGRYALVAVADDCGVLSLLTSRGGRPGVGPAWETAGRGCANVPGTAKQRLASHEAFAFRVDFCDVGTQVSGRTWGEIKTVYR